MTFESGADLVDVAEAHLELLDRRRAAGDGVTDRASVVADLGAAPVTAAYSGAESIDLDAAVRLAARVAEREETLRTFVADGTVFHSDGAGDAQELAYAVAAGLEYVRALVAGMSADTAPGRSRSDWQRPTTSSRRRRSARRAPHKPGGGAARGPGGRWRSATRGDLVRHDVAA